MKLEPSGRKIFIPSLSAWLVCTVHVRWVFKSPSQQESVVRITADLSSCISMVKGSIEMRGLMSELIDQPIAESIIKLHLLRI